MQGGSEGLQACMLLQAPELPERSAVLAQARFSDHPPWPPSVVAKAVTIVFEALEEEGLTSSARSVVFKVGKGPNLNPIS